MLDSGFEVGFEKPSLDNPVLFGRYAEAMAARLQQRYSASGGYRVVVEKEDKDPKKRKWLVSVFGGFLSGAKIEIKPIESRPHRAMVTVGWNSRLMELFNKFLAVLSLLIFVPTFILMTVATRLGFALILTVVMFFVWALVASLIMGGIARLFAAVFGNEFDAQRRAMLSTEIKSVPLPVPPPAPAVPSPMPTASRA